LEEALRVILHSGEEAAPRTLPVPIRRLVVVEGFLAYALRETRPIVCRARTLKFVASSQVDAFGNFQIIASHVYA